MQSGNKYRTIQCGRGLLKVFCGCCVPRAASGEQFMITSNRFKGNQFLIASLVNSTIAKRLCILRIKLQNLPRPESGQGFGVLSPNCEMNECITMAVLDRFQFSVTAAIKSERFVDAILSKVNYRVECSVGALVEFEEFRFDIDIRLLLQQSRDVKLGRHGYVNFQCQE